MFGTSKPFVASVDRSPYSCLRTPVNFTSICDEGISQSVMEASQMDMDPTNALFSGSHMEFFAPPTGPTPWLGAGQHDHNHDHDHDMDSSGNADAAHDASLIMALAHSNSHAHAGHNTGAGGGGGGQGGYPGSSGGGPAHNNDMPEFSMSYPGAALAALTLRGQSPHHGARSPLQTSGAFPAASSAPHQPPNWSDLGAGIGGPGSHRDSLSPSTHVVPGSHPPRSGPSPGFQRSTSSPSSRGSSRAGSPNVTMDRQRSVEEMPGAHVRSHSSPAIALRGAAVRPRHGSFGSAQKSPLRAGFGMAQTSGSPLPTEDDDDDGSAPYSPGRRALDDTAVDEAGPVKRVRGNISRSSSLPMTSRRPPLSPVVSPRVSRRASRAFDSDHDHESPSASPVPTVPGIEGVLRLAIPPSQFGRFRYEAEGRQNCLEGEEKGTYPTVELAPEWAAMCPDGTYVTVSLVRRDDLRAHHHVLASKDGGPTQQPLLRGRATFPNLVVKRQRSEVRYPSEDQRAVRLLFTVSFPRDGAMMQGFVVSPPIFNADLRISRVSHKAGPMAAPTDVLLFCSKVQKKSVGVLITDNTDLSFLPEVPDTWVRTADGSHLFLVQHGIEVHHQFGLAFRFPPCFDAARRSDVSVPVFFQLVDTADSIASDFEAFTYISSDYDTNI